MKTLQNSLISLNERMNVRKKERFPKPWDVFRKVGEGERIREGVGGGYLTETIYEKAVVNRRVLTFKITK